MDEVIVGGRWARRQRPMYSTSQALWSERNLVFGVVGTDDDSQYKRRSARVGWIHSRLDAVRDALWLGQKRRTTFLISERGGSSIAFCLWELDHF